jgi:hypothetical protein
MQLLRHTERGALLAICDTQRPHHSAIYDDRGLSVEDYGGKTTHTGICGKSGFRPNIGALKYLPQ